MSANTPASRAKSLEDNEHALLIASRRYMSDKISLDELERIQHIHAHKLKIAVLAELGQPTWMRYIFELFRKL